MTDKTKPEEAGKPEAPSVPLETLAADKAGALHPKDTIETAGERMRAHGADVWPVTEDRALVGVVENENPDWKLGGFGHDPKDWKVGQIMNREFVFCYEDQDCGAARELMAKHDLRHLPVVDRQMRIVGIFSREEIERQAREDAATPPSKSA